MQYVKSLQTDVWTYGRQTQSDQKSSHELKLKMVTSTYLTNFFHNDMPRRKIYKNLVNMYRLPLSFESLIHSVIKKKVLIAKKYIKPWGGIVINFTIIFLIYWKCFKPKMVINSHVVSRRI